MVRWGWQSIIWGCSMVQGESCLKPPPARWSTAELFNLGLFKATFKPETALLCWGKLQWVTLLPLWQGDNGDKGKELFTQAHAEVWKAPLDTKPRSVIASSTRHLQGVGVYRQACYGWGAARVGGRSDKDGV